MNYLLPLLLLFPIFGAILAAVIPRAETAKLWALSVSAITAVIAVGVWLNLGEPYTMPIAPDLQRS